MKGDPPLTMKKIDKLHDALRAVAETDQVNQPHYIDPRAHEVRDEISRAQTRVVGMLRSILESPHGR